MATQPHAVSKRSIGWRRRTRIADGVILNDNTGRRAKLVLIPQLNPRIRKWTYGSAIFLHLVSSYPQIFRVSSNDYRAGVALHRVSLHVLFDTI